MRRRPAGRHLDPRHLPPLLEAGFLRARAELDAGNLRRVAKRGEGQAGLGEPLASVVAGETSRTARYATASSNVASSTSGYNAS